MRNFRPLAAAGLAVALLAACSSEAPSEADYLRGDAPFITNASNPSAQSGVVAASTALGLALAGLETEQNVVASPASAIIALAMLASGGEGDSEAQLAAVLGASGQARDEAVNSLSAALARYSGDLAKLDVEKPPETPFVHLANQVVIRPDLQVHTDYLDSLSSWYDAGVLSLDLADTASKATLDAWVKENTAGLIEESAVEPNPDLVMVLQNAVLLAAQWQTTFDNNKSYDEDFTTATGEVVQTEMMHDRREAKFAQVQGWKFLELPYDDALAARFFLPPQGVDPASADPALLAELIAAASAQTTQISLPVLDLASKLDLVGLLQSLGVEDVFTPGAGGLSHISDDGRLYVSQVVQQGRIKQDELGTVAAAVTEIAVETTGLIVEDFAEFHATHPHLVVISDLETGWDLFTVAVRNPAIMAE